MRVRIDHTRNDQVSCNEKHDEANAGENRPPPPSVPAEKSSMGR
jgi:hypothetical protein